MKAKKSGETPRASGGEIALLLRILDECYDKKAWHGPNLKGAIRGLDAAEAAWRPGTGRRSIADIVAHAAYWKYAVRRRLRGDKRGSFALEGSNWFELPSPWTEQSWKSYGRLLDREHRALRDTLASFPADRLHELPEGGKVRFFTQIYSVALHDVYHAGQIQLLKRLLPRER
jgi:uncharacterized damage-inducible protein DinB